MLLLYHSIIIDYIQYFVIERQIFVYYRTEDFIKDRNTGKIEKDISVIVVLLNSLDYTFLQNEAQSLSYTKRVQPLICTFSYHKTY